ncbi:penicillin-binding protein 1C [Rheinheimera sp.]|uniref:penicillin-binding protein 1C n=1 Tax=Rheinheimera sp. TaxID=1869214 RepID=UPI002353340B|nr:penicillin-binding protein 1C [Rheinheimera sp.]
MDKVSSVKASGRNMMFNAKALKKVLKYATVALLLMLAVAFLLLSLLPAPALYPQYQQSGAYFAADGSLLSLRLAADQRYRLKVPLSDIAPSMQQATLLYEDRRFYQHPGVDLPAIGRAFWQSVLKGGRRQGASTLSMQLVRLRFALDTSHFAGKLQQLVLALYLEWHYSKDEILEAYFNYAPYGGNIEGVAAASLIYFGKEAKDLTVQQALALSVIPQNPNLRSPLTKQGEQQLELARQRLLSLWLQHYPQQQVSAARLALPLTFLHRTDLPFAAPHFINQLQAQGELQGRFYTSLQADTQQAMQHQLSRYLRRNSDKGFNNASALLIKRSTMQIIGWLGSADFNDVAIAGQVDGVTAPRSPGSALKPFVYALALQQGLIHPLSLVNDLPRRFGSFNPENFDRQFAGPVSATEALINSRNLPAVQLQAGLTAPDFYHWLSSAGVPLPHSAEYYGLALVLGGMELSMQQLVQLYAMLGNGGNWQALQWFADSEPQPAKPVLTPEAAFLTLDMLRQHPKPQSVLLQQLTDTAPVAWKTGTSYAFRDAWAIALRGDYVLAVWLGNFDGSSNPNLIGRSAAGPLLFELLALLPQQADAETALFTPAADLNLKKVALCSRSGDLPNKYCPHTREGWFIPGVSPIRMSDIHRAVPVYKATGLRACQHQPPQTELKVYEFWPSDIASAFSQAGIVLSTAPRYQQACSGVPMLSVQPPQIRSPQPSLIYQLGQTAQQRQIALQASFDGAVTKAHWFIDNRYLGAVTPGETLFWPGEAGTFQLRVVDDLGGVASISLQLRDSL